MKKSTKIRKLVKILSLRKQHIVVLNSMIDILEDMKKRAADKISKLLHKIELQDRLIDIHSEEVSLLEERIEYLSSLEYQNIILKARIEDMSRVCREKTAKIAEYQKDKILTDKIINEYARKNQMLHDEKMDK